MKTAELELAGTCKRHPEDGYTHACPTCLAELEADANRLAELEAGPFLHRGACAYCEWTTDILGAPEESDALAAEHAAQCKDNPQVKRIAELEAGIQQLAASGVAPAKLLDLLNRQERP